MVMLPIEKFEQLTEIECIKMQLTLAQEVLQYNDEYAANAKTIAGVDLAYWTDERERAVCCIVVIDIKNKIIVEKTHATGVVTFPYIPGCLAFRELPLVVKAAQQLNAQPDLYMFDGNGLLHPRRMGLATHASFYLNRPTFGVAKSYFNMQGAQFKMPENETACYTDISVDNEVYGRTVRTHKNVKPIFVSVGNHINLDTATNITLSLVEGASHIPIPTRYADLETHLMRDKLKSNISKWTAY